MTTDVYLTMRYMYGRFMFEASATETAEIITEKERQNRPEYMGGKK